jgi:hypothetical protein
MKQNHLFNQTRINLALFYAGVMGLILTLLGVGVYRAITHAHWVTLDRELESVAGTLHNSLELKLKTPRFVGVTFSNHTYKKNSVIFNKNHSGFEAERILTI